MVDPHENSQDTEEIRARQIEALQEALKILDRLKELVEEPFTKALEDSADESNEDPN